jgi:PH/SEC7 domain-containing protein
MGWSGSMSSGAFNTHGYSGSKDSSKLRVHHRPTASTSEPSLIPRDDDHAARGDPRHMRLVPSVGSSFSRSETVSPITPPDIGPTGDLVLLGGNDTTTGEEPDIDSKAKSLASRCWAEDEEFLAKEKIAEWLGGRSVPIILRALPEPC